MGEKTLSMDAIRGSRVKQITSYFIKACVLVIIAYLLSLALPSMPSPAVALFWAAFTVVSMLGLLYQMSINKAHRQYKYIKGGVSAWFNNGRILRIIASFVLSAIFSASLLLESPGWNAVEWGLIVAAVVLYPLVEVAARCWARNEYETLFRTSGTLCLTCIVVGLLLCAGYAAYSWFWPTADQLQVGDSAFNVLASTPRPFADASSALLQDAGISLWITNSAISFGLTQVSQISWPVCFVARIVLCAGAFFGIANLLGVCSLPVSELRKSFISTDAIKNNDSQAPLRKSYFVIVGVLLVALIGGFVWCDAKIAQAMQTESGTALQSLTRQLAGQSAYIIDGKYCDQNKIDSMIESLAKEEAKLKVMSFNLKDEIRDSYSACEGGVDSFLDWYFSIATNDQVRSELSKEKDNVRETVERQFYADLVSGKDAEITKKVRAYLAAASDLKEHIDEGIRDAEIEKDARENIPDWLFEAKDCADVPLLSTYRQEAEYVLDAARDSGIEGAFSNDQSLLEYQFESEIYRSDIFNNWVKTADEAVNDGDFAKNILHYWQGVLDKGKKDDYRKAIIEALGKCQKQAEMLIVTNALIESGLSSQ